MGLAPGPVALAATKDRLLLVHPAGAAAFSSAAPLNRVLNPIVSQLWRDVWKQLGLQRFAGPGAGLGGGAGGEGGEGAEGSGSGSTSGGSASASSGSGSASVSGSVSGGAPLAATAGQLVVVSLGPTGVAIFDAVSAGAGAKSASQASAAPSPFSGAAGGPDWMKLLQPLVVVMMVGVGIWQFRRASRMGGGGSAIDRRSLAAQRRAAALLGAAGPDLLGPYDRDGLGELGGSLDDILGPGGGGYGGLGSGRHGGGSLARRRQQQQQQHQGGPLSFRASGGAANRAGGLRRRGVGGLSSASEGVGGISAGEGLMRGRGVGVEDGDGDGIGEGLDEAATERYKQQLDERLGRHKEDGPAAVAGEAKASGGRRSVVWADPVVEDESE